MAARTFVITGTDTGVGKTVLTAALARYLRQEGTRLLALKPISSGTRQDARALRAALDGGLPLDQVNPWHFQAPLSPMLAARREHRTVRLASVLLHLRKLRKCCDVLLVEGAGGLLSPLGENFDTRDLVVRLRAIPIVVAPNRLGALNQVLLVWAALPHAPARKAQVVLVSPPRDDQASRSNRELLAELIGGDRVHVMPRLKDPLNPSEHRPYSALRRMLTALLRSASRS